MVVAAHLEGVDRHAKLITKCSLQGLAQGKGRFDITSNLVRGLLPQPLIDPLPAKPGKP